MATNYDGNDLDEWIKHFGFSEKITNVLKETFEANFVDDLAYVYDDAEMLRDVEKSVSRLEYKKFLDVRRKTTRISPPNEGTTIVASSVTSASVVNVTSQLAAASISPPLPPPQPQATSPSILPSAPPLPPAASPYSPVHEGIAPVASVDRDIEAKKKELAEMERKIFEEKEKHRRAIEKTKQIEKKKKMINALEEKIRRAASLDIVFLLDCTGSMRAFIDATKNDIKEFVSSISSLHPNISLRLAFIGYRDHCDKEDRLAVMRFTNSVQEFKNMVGNQVAKGGGDDAEDVLGGLHVVRGLDWSSETRILYHIADAPCHGRDFHRSDCSDDFPEGDPNGLKPDDILNDLLGLRVQYFFGKIKDRTDLMVSRFNELVNDPTASQPFVTTTPITGGTMMTVITRSVTASFSESLSSSARTEEGKLAKKEVLLDATLPTWEIFPVEETLRFAMTMPNTLEEYIDNLTYSDDDKCISDFPDREHFRVKVAKLPFAKGEMRAAYFGQLITGLNTMSGIILKESLAISATQLTKPKYEAFLHCHRAAKAFAIEFNRIKPADCPRIEFVDACIIQFMARKDQPFMIQESQILDKFEKYNNNSGYCAPNPTLHGTRHDAIQAFSHWTYQASNERIMVVDCQGGYNQLNRCFMLTDPAIHFVDVTHFGGTNMGRPGMVKFFETHQCNEYCQALRLVKPT